MPVVATALGRSCTIGSGVNPPPIDSVVTKPCCDVPFNFGVSGCALLIWSMVSFVVLVVVTLFSSASSVDSTAVDEGVDDGNDGDDVMVGN